MKFLLIPANSDLPLKLINIKEGDTLEALQNGVGGYIERIPTPTDEINIWGNEEGKILNLPVNSRATLFWNQIYNNPLSDVLVGNVVITGGPDRNGDTTGVPESVIKAMTAVNTITEGNSRIHRQR